MILQCEDPEWTIEINFDFERMQFTMKCNNISYNDMPKQTMIMSNEP